MSPATGINMPITAMVEVGVYASADLKETKIKSLNKSTSLWDMIIEISPLFAEELPTYILRVLGHPN
jgi:hypothetical protein